MWKEGGKNLNVLLHPFKTGCCEQSSKEMLENWAFVSCPCHILTKACHSCVRFWGKKSHNTSHLKVLLSLCFTAGWRSFLRYCLKYDGNTVQKHTSTLLSVSPHFRDWSGVTYCLARSICDYGVTSVHYILPAGCKCSLMWCSVKIKIGWLANSTLSWIRDVTVSHKSK